MSWHTICYLDETGELSSACKHVITDHDLLKMYRAMITTRHVDERMLLLQREGLVPFAMSSRGEEACAVASAAALHIEDWMYPQYRESGIMFWRGFSIQEYVHHMLGNALDLNKGRQLSNHFGSRNLNVVTVSSPVGTQIPHAAGCAYAMKIKKEPQISITYFGEGTTSEGDFHSGVNFAAVTKSPVIFFCRNNGYAISTPCSRQFASDGVAPKGVGYGVITYRIDGNDVFAIHETTSKARQECLQGRGPVLIEAMTYRLGMHSTSDNSSLYRSVEEVNGMEAKCPILRLRTYLEKRELWNESENRFLMNQIKEEVDQAIQIAKQTPPPSIKMIFEDVYEKMTPNLKNQYALKMQEKQEGNLCRK